MLARYLVFLLLSTVCLLVMWPSSSHALPLPGQSMSVVPMVKANHQPSSSRSILLSESKTPAHLRVPPPVPNRGGRVSDNQPLRQNRWWSRNQPRRGRTTSTSSAADGRGQMAESLQPERGDPSSLPPQPERNSQMSQPHGANHKPRPQPERNSQASQAHRADHKPRLQPERDSQRRHAQAENGHQGPQRQPEQSAPQPQPAQPHSGIRTALRLGRKPSSDLYQPLSVRKGLRGFEPPAARKRLSGQEQSPRELQEPDKTLTGLKMPDSPLRGMSMPYTIAIIDNSVRHVRNDIQRLETRLDPSRPPNSQRLESLSTEQLQSRAQTIKRVEIGLQTVFTRFPENYLVRRRMVALSVLRSKYAELIDLRNARAFLVKNPDINAENARHWGPEIQQPAFLR
ncbi:hypothetical protein XA68_11577 [Ophiocordyceps unilateralis]|uniref:Uncharacterized protein n=1 Tax=Ophiocordyceps unilateralis TaxID=268505 RepID=A0A2A9PFJ3_OPHUN|nr:hypothetical protein XA68_11577 [Ophiocordyceps unilateralis]